MYGLTKALSQKNRKKLMCHKTIDREIISYDDEHPYGYKVYSTYHFAEDEKEILNVTSTSSFTKMTIEKDLDNKDIFFKAQMYYSLATATDTGSLY